MAIELLVRGVAALGLVTLPSTEIQGFDRARQGEDASIEKRLYQVDRNLITSMRPNAQISYVRTGLYPEQPTHYTVHTNQWGFRAPSFSERKREGTFRILCLGDSSTFGFNVEAEDAYPAVLARQLNEIAPGRYEVLNLGIPGHTSRQGLELLRQVAERYQPDLVTFAFGTNDRFWHRPLSDDALITLNQSTAGGVILGTRAALDRVYTYRLLRRLLAALTYRFVDPSRANNAGPPRVALDELRDNIAAAAHVLGEVGAKMIVLNNDFFVTDAGPAIAAGAQAIPAPLINVQELFASKRRERSRDLEARFNLPAATVPPGQALMRVWTKTPKQGVLVELSPLFSTQKTRYPLRDDGLMGDQVAGDGVWSGYIRGAPGDRITYRYLEQTPTGLRYEYEEPTVGGAARQQAISPSRTTDIDTFGTVYLHSDASHPDEEGHRLIAEQLRPHVLALSGVHAD